MGENVILTTATPNTYPISLSVGTPPANNPDQAGYATVGDGNCSIQFTDDLFDASRTDYVQPVVWHELGHCSGQHHVLEVGEIMYPMTEAESQYTTPETQRFFSTVHSLIGM